MKGDMNAQLKDLFSLKTLDLISDYLGRVLQICALVYLVIAIIVVLVTALSQEYFALLVLWLTAGLPAAVFSAIVLYAFGQLIHDIHEIKKQGEKH